MTTELVRMSVLGGERAICATTRSPGTLAGRIGPPTSEKQCSTGDDGRREPHPHELTRQDRHTARGKEAPDAHRRDEDRPPREEVPLVHERREERDPAATRGHRVQHAVRRRGEKEYEPQPPRRGVRGPVANRQECDGGEQRREEE